MKSVILAAGKGTRMREITQDIPKPMLRLANKALLEHTVNALHDAGIKDVLMVVQYQKDKIINYFQDGSLY